MSVVIGLDIGGSTTKVVGFEGDKLLQFAFVKASDPVAAAYGGIGKFLNINHLKLSDIDKIMMTGVGASYINSDLLEHPTLIAPEFESVGRGGRYISGIDSAIVVSMGTGTSIVYSDKKGTEHIIGSGVGGGTVLGLANRMINVRDFQLISDMSAEGDIGNIDLSIGDISRSEIPGLSSDTTASNFGKVSDSATPQDLALGIVNMVFQSVGTNAVLCARMKNIRDIVFVGSLTKIEQGRATLANFSKLYNVNIRVPNSAEYSTAIGAALTGMES